MNDVNWSSKRNHVSPSLMCFVLLLLLPFRLYCTIAWARYGVLTILEKIKYIPWGWIRMHFTVNVEILISKCTDNDNLISSTKWSICKMIVKWQCFCCSCCCCAWKNGPNQIQQNVIRKWFFIVKHFNYFVRFTFSRNSSHDFTTSKWCILGKWKCNL